MQYYKSSAVKSYMLSSGNHNYMASGVWLAPGKLMSNGNRSFPTPSLHRVLHTSRRRPSIGCFILPDAVPPSGPSYFPTSSLHRVLHTSRRLPSIGCFILPDAVPPSGASYSCRVKSCVVFCIDINPLGYRQQTTNSTHPP